MLVMKLSSSPPVTAGPMLGTLVVWPYFWGGCSQRHLQPGSSFPFSVHLLNSLWSACVELGFIDQLHELLVLGKYCGWNKPGVTSNPYLPGEPGTWFFWCKDWESCVNRYELVTWSGQAHAMVGLLPWVALSTSFLGSDESRVSLRRMWHSK